MLHTVIILCQGLTQCISHHCISLKKKRNQRKQKQGSSTDHAIRKKGRGRRLVSTEGLVKQVSLNLAF